jgi:class 3 adenylate cyclase/ketosteroid isomerase-like protein/tetratricopeptide (TPR) repeat protein
MTCASCGRDNREGARFCDAFGTALVARAAPPGGDTVARKVVTIVFADLIGSTGLHERLDPESVSRVMDRYYQTVRAPVEAHGGTVVQLLGDGVMCAFGVPRVAEDDAIRAVRAAVGMQRAFRDFAGEQREVVGSVGLRVAVNTGEVVVSDDHAAGIGDPLNVAARLQQEAHDGDVLIGESTQRLVRELVSLEPFGVFSLKGRSETVTAYRVVSLARPAGGAATPFVGREEELRRLAAIYDETVAVRSARLAVVLGSPGLGKSRLLTELGRCFGQQATVLNAHCSATGGATLAPLAETLRGLLRLDDSAGGDAVRAAVDAAAAALGADRARIADGIAALLAGAPAVPQETFFVVRRLLAVVAMARPVVLTIDDLQWAEPLLLDFVEHLVQWSSRVPLLVLAAARPELREVRAGLTERSELVREVVTLSGLDAGAATRLAANVIGAGELPAALAGRVLATSEGNPLFVGELVRMLVHDGALRREGDRWTAGVELAALEMPPTIHALLAGRIERLRPEERVVLERAAVVGRQFSRAAVADLLPGEIADLDARLEALQRSELIEPDTGWLLGEPLLRFHHVLIRDAAYRRLLKGTRAELHARFADWLQARAGEAVEHDATIGWHYEQAHQHLRELGPIDASGRQLGDRAAHYLAAAGRRALSRDDLPRAANLLGRALERLHHDDPQRAELALDWCEALLAAGEVGPAAAAIDELGRFTGREEDDKDSRDNKDESDTRHPTPDTRLQAWHTCFAGQLAVLTDPQSLRATADAVAAAAARLAAAGDAAGEAKGHAVHALALARLGKIGASEEALDQALAAARQGRDRRRANAVLAGAPLAALWGPSPVTRASGRCLDVVRVLRITQGAPAVEAVALRCQAVLEALRGRSDAARRMIDSSRRLVEELGITQRLLEADMFAGLIDLLEGDAVAAERSLRGAYEGLRSRGLGIDAAQAAALLGRALLAQGRAAEAEALSHESETLAGDDLKAAIAWRGVRAEALARRGEHAEAIALARAAVDIAAATDALLDHADARLALAAVLRAAGRGDEAGAEETRAIELWDAKGATLPAERARHAGGYAAGADGERGTAPAAAVRRRVRENLASDCAARLDAAVAARDTGALSALIPEHLTHVDHPAGAVYDGHGVLFSLRSLWSGSDVTFRHEVLATLGDLLAVSRRTVSASATIGKHFDVAAYERDEIVVAEVGHDGTFRRVEVFARDRLSDAVPRLYECYAETLPEGAERARAAATARSVAALLGPFDLDRYATGLAADVEFADHRSVGFPSGRGADELLRSVGSLLDAADDVAVRVHDVLAAAPDALVVRWTTSGTERISRGPFEYPFVRLLHFGADGLAVRAEQFDVDRAGDALARFDQLATRTGDPLTDDAAPARIVNAAMRTQARFERCWLERDWNAVIALYAPGVVLDDRRSVVGVQLQGEEFFANQRILFAAPSGVWHSTLRATRGERLALFHVWFTAAPEGGAILVEHLGLVEVDAAEHYVYLALFDLDDLDAAYDALDERYAGGEGAPGAALRETWRRFRAALTSADRAALAEVLADDFSGLSHRRFANTGMRVGRDEYLATLDFTDQLTDRFDLRLDHVLRLSPAAAVGVLTACGTVSGGDFEQEIAFVVTLSGGRLTSLEMFDPDGVDAALARYEVLAAAPAAVARIETTATRTEDLTQEIWAVHDWERFIALFAPGFRSIDRRTMMHLELDRDALVTSVRHTFEMGATRKSEVLATRGDRLLLARVFLSVADTSAGPSELEYLQVSEVDADGSRTASIAFDVEDLDAAYAELDSRFAAGEAAAHAGMWQAMETLMRATATRDWDAFASALAPDLVFHDHRVLGWGVLRPDEYVRRQRALVELAPDARLGRDHLLALDDRAALSIASWVGSRDGGPFEIRAVNVMELGDDRKIRRWQIYDLDQLDAARRSYAEAIRPGRPSGIENAATRGVERARAACLARDWTRFGALFPPGFRSIDRRAMVQLELDRDQTFESFRPILEMTAGVEYEVLATRGDRLALIRWLWKGVDHSAWEAEVEFVAVIEVDDGGEHLALVMFDGGELEAAYTELDARYDAVQAASTRRDGVTRAFTRAFAARDWGALAALLAPDLVVHDHRLLGWEPLHGPDAYVQALRSLIDLAPDVRLRIDHIAMAQPGYLYVTTWLGSHEGGVFETPSAIVCRIDAQGRICRFDQYDLDHLDRARAQLQAIAAGVVQGGAPPSSLPTESPDGAG